LEFVMVLGLETNQWVAVGIGIACVVALLIIVVAPWSKIRSERPLSRDTETRLLLGENPAEIADDEDTGGRTESPSSPRADVFDLDPERRSSA
jgi:hypothetical protein